MQFVESGGIGMNNRSRVALLLLTLTSAALIAACSSPAASQKASSSPPATGTPSDALLKLDSQDRGELSGVDLEPGGAFIAFKPEQRAVERRWSLAKVGVHDHAQGVRSVLIVPMWFDERTRFVESPWMKGVDTLNEAIKHPEWAWSAAGTADIKFHLTDGVFYIDEVSMPPDRASDPNR
jgi:hypothetical protein